MANTDCDNNLLNCHMSELWGRNFLRKKKDIKDTYATRSLHIFSFLHHIGLPFQPGCADFLYLLHVNLLRPVNVKMYA